MKSKKDLWKICWKLTRTRYNQITPFGGVFITDTRNIKTVRNISKFYSALLDEESNDMLRKAKNTYFSRSRNGYVCKDHTFKKHDKYENES